MAKSLPSPTSPGDTSTPVVPALGWLESWLDRIRAWAGVLALASLGVVVLQVVLGFLLVNWVFDCPGCTSAEYEANQRQLEAFLVPYGVVFAVALVVFVVATIAWLSLLANRVRVARYERRFGPRVQSAKDWFAQGLLTEEEFETFRRPADLFLDGAAPGERMLLSGKIAVRLGVFFAAVAVVAGMLLNTILRDYGEPYELGFVATSLLAAIVLALLLPAGIGLRVRGRRAVRASLGRLQSLEEDLIVAAHRRSTS